MEQFKNSDKLPKLETGMTGDDIYKYIEEFGQCIRNSGLWIDLTSSQQNYVDFFIKHLTYARRELSPMLSFSGMLINLKDVLECPVYNFLSFVFERYDELADMYPENMDRFDWDVRHMAGE